MNKLLTQAAALLVGATTMSFAAAAPAVDQASGLQHVQNVQSVPKNTEGQNFNELITELSRLEQRLAAIQRDAIVQNPSLRTEARELQSLLVETMEEQGYSPTERLERIQQIQSELANPEIDQQQRQELIAEAQTEQQELSQAEQKAMERQEVQQAALAFETKLVQAMQEQDPNAERLLDEYEARSQELQAMLEQQSAPIPPEE